MTETVPAVKTVSEKPMDTVCLTSLTLWLNDVMKWNTHHAQVRRCTDFYMVIFMH